MHLIFFSIIHDLFTGEVNRQALTVSPFHFIYFSFNKGISRKKENGSMENKGKELQKEYSRKWKEAHKEQVKAHKRKWYDSNKDYFKEYREKNKEHIQEVQKQWRDSNRDRVNANHRQWMKEHPGKSKEYNDRYWMKKAQELENNSVNV